MTDFALNTPVLSSTDFAANASGYHDFQVPPPIVEGTDVEIAEAVLFSLAQRYGSRIVRCEGKFYAYTGTHWRPLASTELKNAIYGYDKTRHAGKVVVRLNTPRTGSILTIMGVRADEPDFFVNAPKGMNCKSGFIEFDSSGAPRQSSHSPEHRQRHCLPGQWSPDSSWQEAKLLKAFLHGCFGEDDDGDDKIALVSEACGIAALGGATRLSSPKALVLLGTSAANGKSELLAMLSGLLPKDAVCAIPLSRFSDERMLAQLAGRMLNACAELGTSRAIAAETFKAVVTGDEIVGREVFCPATFFRPVALHIFATNALPPFHGGIDPGVERRLLVLSFKRTIPEDQRIAEIGSRIANEEANALLAFAVEGAGRVLRAGRFIQPATSRQTLREWVYQADPVLAWKERRTAYTPAEQTPVGVAYADFLNWAENEGIETKKLPAAHNFVNKLRCHEGRLAKGSLNKVRVIRGLKLNPEEC